MRFGLKKPQKMLKPRLKAVAFYSKQIEKGFLWGCPFYNL